jgi:hypothetical protein
LRPNFTQTIRLHCSQPAKLLALVEQWDQERAQSDLTGYMGSRVLADREQLGQYLCVIEFGVIDPNVTAAEEAAMHNELPETKAMAAAVAEIIDGPLEYHHYDEVYRTDH